MLSLIVDTSNPNQNGLLYSFASPGQGIEQDFIKGDIKLALMHRPVVPSVTNSRPWDDDFQTGDTFQVAIGNPDTPPTGGTVALGVQRSTTKTVASVSAAFPAVVTTTGAHGYATGDVVIMSGTSGITPDINAQYFSITVTGSTTFTIPVNVTVGASTGGTVTSFNTTGLTALAWNISAATLQTALASVSVTEGYGSLAATLFDPGNYQVAWTTPGAVPNLYADGSNLLPASAAFVAATQTGTGTVVAKQILELLQQPVAYCQPSTLLPSAAIAAAITQAGSGTANKIYSLTMTSGTYGGTFAFTIMNLSSVAASGIASGTISAADFQSQLNALSIFTDGDIAVTRTGDVLTVQFQGTQQHSNVPTLAATNIDLLAPKGVTGSMDLNTVNLYVAFAQTTADTLSYTFAIRRTRTTGEEAEYFQHDVTLKRSIINAATLVGLSLPAYYTKAQVDAIIANIWDGTNLLAGAKFRIAPITNGAKIQVSTDGVTWQDGPSYVAS